MRYFWLLDPSVPKNDLKKYSEKMAQIAPHSSSELNVWIQLLKADIPFPPKAYMSSGFSPQADPSSLEVLGGLIENFESLTQRVFGGEQDPLLLSVRGGYCGTIRNMGVSAHSLGALIPSLWKRTFLRFLCQFLGKLFYFGIRRPLC